MVHATHLARDQIRALRACYLKKERYEAYLNLMKVIRETRAEIEANPNGGLPHPRPYPGMAKRGFRWIFVRGYWVGWSMARGYPVVTNVFYATSRMWRRVAPDKGGIEPF